MPGTPRRGAREPAAFRRWSPPQFVWDAEDIFDALGSGEPGRSSDGAWVHPEFRRDVESTHGIAQIWHGLRQNRDFLLLFADRVYRSCFGDGALTDERARERWWALNRHIEQAILGESARWGDALEAEGGSVRTREKDWLPEVIRVSSVSLEGNAARLIEALRAEGFYPSVDPPRLDRPGGAIAPAQGIRLEASDESGAIYYTLDGSDPRVPVTGRVAETAHRYTGPIVLGESAALRARVVAEGEWSALAEAEFYVLGDLSALRVTEIMYHPPRLGPPAEEDEDDYEFLELKNCGAVPLDLSGARFSSGVACRFPLGSRLGPGEILVLVSDPEAFSDRYGDAPFHGVYGGHLSNDGETVRVSDSAGNTIIEVTYDDAYPWPEGADGGGYSLTAVEPSSAGDPNDPGCWRASTGVFGSPGSDDILLPEFLRGDSNADGRVDISDATHVLLFLFLGLRPDPCEDARDVNDDGTIDVTDPIALLWFLYRGGSPPAAPFPRPGLDPTDDALLCPRRGGR